MLIDVENETEGNTPNPKPFPVKLAELKTKPGKAFKAPVENEIAEVVSVPTQFVATPPDS